MSGIKEIIERVRDSPNGTLIMIYGKTGSGKTTLALKLMRDINSCDDIACISSREDIQKLECIRSDKRLRAYLVDEVLHTNSDDMERAIKLAEIGYIPIITVCAIYGIPRQYRGASPNGVRSVLEIKVARVKDDGVKCSALYSSYDPVKKEYYNSVQFGGITERGVESVRNLLGQYRESKLGKVAKDKYEQSIPAGMNNDAIAKANDGAGISDEDYAKRVQRMFVPFNRVVGDQAYPFDWACPVCGGILVPHMNKTGNREIREGYEVVYSLRCPRCKCDRAERVKWRKGNGANGPHDKTRHNPDTGCWPAYMKALQNASEEVEDGEEGKE